MRVCLGTMMRTAEKGHNEIRGRVEATLDIPFRTAARGGKVRSISRLAKKCPTCHGTGAAPGASLKICPDATVAA